MEIHMRHFQEVLSSLFIVILLSATAQADSILKVDNPATLTTPGYEHIYWQKVDYSQGGCPVDLTAIVYWSPSHVTQSEGDIFYTPYMNIHGGGWSARANYEPADADGAQAIHEIVSQGLLYILPTYRGEKEKVTPTPPNCSHSKELIADAAFFVNAVDQRHAEIPQSGLIRAGENIRLIAASAGGHVGMRLAAEHPQWFERILLVSGIYDFQHWRENWDDDWQDFSDREYDQCLGKFDDEILAVTNLSQNKTVQPFLHFEVLERNCSHVAQRAVGRQYTIKESGDSGKWAKVNFGGFIDVEKDIGNGETKSVTLFFPVFELAAPASSSEPDDSWPIWAPDKAIVITPDDPGNIPILSIVDAKARIAARLSNLADGPLSSFLDSPFLGFTSNDPLLVENSFGTTIQNNAGQYPPFRITSNTGDFALQEQALSFCNDISTIDGTGTNKLISSNAKGEIYQCGNEGTLFITSGGGHLEFTQQFADELASNVYWLLGDWPTDHSDAANQQSCDFGLLPNTGWVTSVDDVNFLGLWNNDDVLGLGTFDSTNYSNEYQATQNDPLYFGPDAMSTTDWFGPYELVFTKGDYVGDLYGRWHHRCVRIM
jgi:pimeloyl-ACP methyl ester carboxylesterase